MEASKQITVQRLAWNIGLLSIRELFTILIAAFKNPDSECCNSELPGTALNVADWPLDFKGLKNSGERFLSPNPVSFSQIRFSYNGRFERNLYPNKTNMVQKKSPGGQNVVNFAYRVPFRV